MIIIFTKSNDDAIKENKEYKVTYAEYWYGNEKGVEYGKETKEQLETCYMIMFCFIDEDGEKANGYYNPRTKTCDDGLEFKIYEEIKLEL